ncbi:MAG: alpha/beta hydrolase [Patulibacter sp.]|nr:alpha/beta hydrolase [Patulibacter sp.]
MAQIDPLLGDGFTVTEIPLAADAEGPNVATLIRSEPAGDEETAVLYVHGYVDYFFQRELAAFHRQRGMAFYALDLRKSGRSLRPHQTPYFVRDLTEYYAELDHAIAAVRAAGHRRVIVNGHSTGGLTAALWAHDRRDGGGPDALALNSPFFDLDLPGAVRPVADGLLAVLGPRRPYQVIPRGLSELYAQSIHRDHRGEWEFDLTLKPIAGIPIRAAWLNAVVQGQRRLHAGLAVPVPTLVMCSTMSSAPRDWDDVLHRSDSVLDAHRIARWAPAVGPHVTVVRVQDGMHDLVLSVPAVRATVYAEIDRWLDSYVPSLQAA